MHQRIAIKGNTEPVRAFLAELSENITPESVEQLVGFLDSGNEVISVESCNFTGTSELTVTLQPSEAFVGLTTAVRAV